MGGGLMWGKEFRRRGGCLRLRGEGRGLKVD